MEYKLKKNYLTRVESNAIIANAMKDFNKSGIIEGLNFDYLNMDERFFDSLGLLCIENYNDEIKDGIYNEGKTEELLASITNASETYDMLYYLADRAASLDNALIGLLRNLPNNDDIKNLDELVPQLKETFDKYDDITRRNNNEETTE
ncbi:MAG: hypothetical protein MSA56_05805 [Clostridium sp.]|nr:hypothetical protein [Clostridium sp.]